MVSGEVPSPIDVEAFHKELDEGFNIQDVNLEVVEALVKPLQHIFNGLRCRDPMD